MPEEQPLQCLIALQLVRETKDVFLVGELEEIKKLCTRLHDTEWGRLSVVYKDRDTTWSKLSAWPCESDTASQTIGIETKEPVLLLLISHDVTTRERSADR